MQKFIKQIQPSIDINEERIVKKVIRTTFITENKYTKEFEDKIKKRVKVKYAIAMSNWTVGLYCCANFHL